LKWLVIIAVAFALKGCSDHHMVKPFECKCDCEKNKFECIGRETATEQDTIKKIIKNNID